ncbi:TlpA disulfide reductase family protein [Elizabethkingia sp. JS20170427COW]|uniref:TlpA family protein disulfide reductase n=1 Tax=Elizabethkingia sp. JS20170427COW TaxID=2583851 RepID=UPI001110D4FE|nr:TlpA disulfide reductase family protein [Elizabethkingia sp. JS20170427COW]QCX53373.1 TlpA family protein disulfide reductase [Elizabethkingia sp. JS20170427COW]
MKKLLLIALCTLFMVSCSNKKSVIISGKIEGASPLERIEIIDITDPATLPIANIGVDAQGNFSDTLEIPKNGVYAITYGGMDSHIYLKGGENLKLSGMAGAFPNQFTVEGDAKNNDFLKKTKTYADNYFSKLSQEIVLKDEAKFLTELGKFKSDINKEIDNIAKTTGADSDLVKWKKEELDVNLLLISGQYVALHGQLTNNPNFKVSEKFTNYQKELVGNEEDKIKNFLGYRKYLLSNIGQGFQEFQQKNQKPGASLTEVFINYLKDKKYSPLVKDYLISFVATSIDMHPQAENTDQLIKVLDENIKDEKVKESIHKVEKAIFGLKVGSETPKVDLLDAQNKKVTLDAVAKGKPTMVVFYSSWAPYTIQSMPIIKQITTAYQAKMNTVFINLDDTFAQAKKTNDSMLKDIKAQKLYAKGGLNSDAAKQFAIYAFKLPSFVIIGKDGKIASKTFMNVMDPELKSALDKTSGMVGPPIAMPQAPVEAAPVDTIKAK